MAEQADNAGPLGAAPSPNRRRGDPTRAAVAAAEHLMDRVRLVDAGVLVGMFCGFDAQGRFLVRMAKGLPPVVAMSVVGLKVEDEGDEVIVSLERGDPSRPVILGRAMRHVEPEAPRHAVRPDMAAHEPIDGRAYAPADEPHDPSDVAEPAPAVEAAPGPALTRRGQSVTVDGERVVLNGAKQVELRCGEASIVLTAAGKILIKGTYVLSRSSGANRIKGAFVDIN
ncbi:DUF6484 domain-containing protein [Roseateles chitinivorans]|uniref:DUF6484 domain-containing protein n=1 Tax=Roseateles chitinivorans TaxID=2917965 RepID=UPI003D66B9A9